MRFRPFALLLIFVSQFIFLGHSIIPHHHCDAAHDADTQHHHDHHGDGHHDHESSGGSHQFCHFMHWDEGVTLNTKPQVSAQKIDPEVKATFVLLSPLFYHTYIESDQDLFKIPDDPLPSPIFLTSSGLRAPPVFV